MLYVLSDIQEFNLYRAIYLTLFFNFDRLKKHVDIEPYLVITRTCLFIETKKHSNQIKLMKP